MAIAAISSTSVYVPPQQSDAPLASNAVLQTGDATQAQPSQASLQQPPQGAKGAHHHHGGHHHGGGAPVASSSPTTDPSTSTTSTNLLDISA
jgi:hypothetical protein